MPALSAGERALSRRRCWPSPSRARRPSQPPVEPRRILLLRLERIGDLADGAPGDPRTCASSPGRRRSTSSSAAGTWRSRAVPAVTRVEALDARWLARGAAGLGLGGAPAPRAAARRRYDLAINFEPDIRSNLLARRIRRRRSRPATSAAAAARCSTGRSTTSRACTPRDNARAARRRGVRPAPRRRGCARADDSRGAADAAARLGPGPKGPLVGMHVSGGRAIKQWPPERFAEVARALAQTCGATIVLTGAAGGCALVAARAALSGLPRNRRVGRRRPCRARGHSRARSTCSSRATPGRCTSPARLAHRSWRSSARPIRPATRCAAATMRWCASTCRAARATASGVPPERCVGHTPDCLATDLRGTGRRRGACGATASGHLRRPRRARMTRAILSMPGGRRHAADRSCAAISRRPGGTRRGRRARLDQEPAPRPGRRRAVAPPLHATGTIRCGGSRSCISTSSRSCSISSAPSPRSTRSSVVSGRRDACGRGAR